MQVTVSQSRKTAEQKRPHYILFCFGQVTPAVKKVEVKAFEFGSREETTTSVHLTDTDLLERIFLDYPIRNLL